MRRLRRLSLSPLRQSPMKVYANLAGVDIGEGFPVRLVGAINVSPESFYPGSVAGDRRALRRLAVQMQKDGAALLDIGAMSTAPYLKGTVPEVEERRRMVAAVSVVREAVALPISADTQRAGVAAAALEAGATVVNDVSGLRHDSTMAAVARHAKGVILMAAERDRSTAAVLPMVARLLRECLARARRARIPRRRIVLDPGIGFFRRAAVPWDQVDCLVLAELAHLHRLGHPLMVGISRKSFIGKLTGRPDADARLWGSLGATAVAVFNGAAVVRTHDVAATRDVVRVAEAIRAGARHGRR